MKLIVAIIQPNKLEEVKEELQKHEIYRLIGLKKRQVFDRHGVLIPSCGDLR
jgi:nitrogen regulatory protein PII